MRPELGGQETILAGFVSGRNAESLHVSRQVRKLREGADHGPGCHGSHGQRRPLPISRNIVSAVNRRVVGSNPYLRSQINSFIFNVAATEHVVCRSAARCRPELRITHPCSNFLVLDLWGPPESPSCSVEWFAHVGAPVPPARDLAGRSAAP
jgi:hypothetical protein